MKSRVARTTHISPGSTWPASTPRKTFSIFLYLVPVHWEIMEIPFLKCRRLAPRGMALKRRSISAFPPTTHLDAQLTMWSLKTPLWSWCSRSGVKQEDMLQWGRSLQNGLLGQSPSRINSLSSPSLAPVMASRIVSELRRTLSSGDPNFLAPTSHRGHQFSLLQAMRHCSRWSATYAHRIG